MFDDKIDRLMHKLRYTHKRSGASFRKAKRLPIPLERFQRSVVEENN